MKILLIPILLTQLAFADSSVKDMIESMKIHKAQNLDLIAQNFAYNKKLLDEAREYYRQYISKEWGDKNIKLSEVKSFTQYSPDLKSRETIDYENEKIVVEKVVDINEKISKEELANNLKTLMKQSIDETYEKDPINKKISQETKEKPILPQEKIVSDLISAKEIKKSKITEKIVTLKDGSQKKIVAMEVKMVPDNLKKRAVKFKTIVDKEAERFSVPKSYVFATIQTESYFNPLAKSHIPAFGLMQIVPHTAGIDAYQALYGEKKLLTGAYLYNPKNNIELGSQYVQIISTRYLRGVKNPTSLLYCTAVSYNAGIGSLYRSFTGSKGDRKGAIAKINSMSDEEVYTFLRNSPKLTSEAKNYVKAIRDRRKNYVAWDM
ncbi:membrane-bound lytic murein transglycosylase C [Epsilonproteobacteria bacterium SCGC AD-308-P11]|jgi:membrane-bound lytic murein transglycosylase C|nr:membrane-bound lytic murein transglycosylase C [Epsilonproteobacteria bacterium SCGC AD-308-P11]